MDSHVLSESSQCLLSSTMSPHCLQFAKCFSREWLCFIFLYSSIFSCLLIFIPQLRFHLATQPKYPKELKYYFSSQDWSFLLLKENWIPQKQRWEILSSIKLTLKSWYYHRYAAFEICLSALPLQDAKVRTKQNMEPFSGFYLINWMRKNIWNMLFILHIYCISKYNII